jgi:hypothetical protein
VEGEVSEAEYALQRARSLFQLAAVRARFGDVARAGPHDATLILRDLALRLNELSGRERSLARGLLARPDGGGVPIGIGWTVPKAPASPDCNADMCLHWVATSGDAPQPADGDSDGIPDWVELTRSTLENVWSQEIDAYGYREPLPDGTSTNDGGDDRLDIYLDDLGSDGVFGYCTSDDPNTQDPQVFAVSAYCVLDNDYAAVQYGTSQTPEEFLQVTSAHEFNHASQFAYDWLDDFWLLEGGATNTERSVYPAVKDNINFLRDFSPLSRPALPLDRGGTGDSEYGSWIFWRFLEEKLYGGDPTVVRRVWERADASTPFAPDDYSLLAVRNVLAADGESFPEAFARFGVANRLRDYEDGSLYPPTPTHGVFGLGPSSTSTGWRTTQLNHLTTRFFAFTLGTNLRSPTAKLRLRLDLTQYGSAATAIVFYKSGLVEVRRLALDAQKNGSFLLPFGRGQVGRVELVLSNGSSRTSCWADDEAPFYSCFGTPRDDGRRYLFNATLAG